MLRDLRRILDRSLPGGVVIAGDAGVGKTRLLGELADRAAADGWAVEWVTGAISTASVPLGALAQLVPEAPGRSPNAAQLMALVREELLSRHEGRPLLLAVDDAPRLDAPSASFVAQLAVMGYCLVACTARSEETLAPQMETLVKDQILDRVDLDPLADSDIEKLIGLVLKGEVDSGAVDRIIRLSEGNPLFLRELLADGVESGSLRIVGERWHFEEPIGGSAGLQRLVSDRLGRLSDSQRAGLEALAVAEPLELDMTGRFFEDGSLEDLERRGVIRVKVQGRRHLVEFVHPLFAETISAAIPVIRRRSINAQLLDAVDTAGARRRDDILRLAVWHLDSGHPLGASRLLNAAHAASSSFDVELAERIALSAIEAGAGPYAELALADAVSKQARVEEAENLIVGLDVDPTDQTLFTSALLCRVENQVMQAGKVDVGVQILKEGRDKVSDPELLAGIDSLLAYCQAFKPDPRAALETSLRIINQPGSPDEAKVGAFTIATLAELWLCEFDALEADVDGGLLLADRFRQTCPDAKEKLLVTRYNGQTYNGQAVQAEQGLRRAYEEAANPPIHPFNPVLGYWFADTLSVRGKLDEAIKVCREAMSWSGVDPIGGIVPHAATMLAVVCGRAGNREGVEAAIETLSQRRTHQAPILSLQIRARAWHQATQGDYKGASDLAHEAGQVALDVDMLISAAWAFHDAVMFGYASDAVRHLRDIASQSKSPTFESFAAHAAALDSTDPTTLQQVAGSFAARGELLFAARAYRQAAQLHQRAGEQTSAARAIMAAQLLIPEAPETAAWGLETELRYLTPRETEIAALAAQGLTSPQIADRLYISVRTVNNHLATVYTKLGVHSRNELVEILEAP